MKRSPERTAWLVLFASLFTCCALAVGVPAAALAFYNTATVEAGINVKLQAGQMSVWRPTQTDRDPPSVVSLDGYDIGEGSLVALSADSAGLLTLQDNASSPPQPLLTVQLYPNARLRVERARLPRFGASALSDEFAFRLAGGRIQVTAHAPDRKISLRISSDHGNVLINTPGLYSIEHTNDALQLNVVEGVATVATRSGEMSLNFSSGQRTMVTASSVAGVLPPPRNLIRNDRFQAALQPVWQVEALAAASDAPLGTARIVEESTARALILERMGEELGWGRTGVVQSLDARVDGGRDLRLVLDFAILFQELPVCASVGSECPLFVSITWRDAKEGVREWIQGFYANGTPQIQPGAPILPDSILTNPQRKHVKMPLGQRVRWESENLFPYLPNVQTIETIKIYAEGHAVRTQINAVALLLTD
ncbi:MAG: hypothetical protein KatS3mg053_2490 [Candidatus Roseilinea sp.]|nr:MAG: hypothetical protein KatS3mg053_2490 [Candidatus Roseilinea sp.]